MQPVRPPDSLGPNSEAGAYRTTETERASRGPGSPACEAGGGAVQAGEASGLRLQLCILITSNSRWLAAPPALGGRRN